MKFCFLLSVFLLICSCQKKKLTCEELREKAKNDFKNNKLTYFEHIKLSDSIDIRKEFRQLLNKNNIKVVFDTISPPGCIPADKSSKPEICYQEMMNNNLHAQFGHHFFDSIRIEAKNEHLKNLK
ncbi:hypothetical protein [Chryseobacterium sp. JUb7]|uniref:hypothetical protein n=1 Tax=Chryseobacterium sp. JUb7 TaxID=2940599 RepID=UPI00216AA7AB|nr:hypothetical protein [Chryseobacterium sp. JUb7]MCS3532199.1 hypothetical protein [Chryseobacterium sp. JUb7]